MRPTRSSSFAAAVAILWGCGDQAFAQTLGQAAGDGDIPVWRVLGALILCLALAVAAAYALRHRLRGSGAPTFGKAFGPVARRLKLVETVRLSHQADICLMRCGDADFVVAATAQGVVLLSAPVDLRLSTEPGTPAP